MQAGQQVLNQLCENRPAWLRGDLPVLASLGKPVAVFGRVSLSAKLIEDGDPNLLAFAMAHAVASDFLVQWIRRTSEWTEPGISKLEELPEWLGVPLTAPVSIAGLAAGLAGIVVEMGEFERESIRRAVAWASAAGFSPSAGVRYFEEGFCIQRDFVEPDASLKSRVIGAAFKPTTFLMDRVRKGPEVFLTNAERAAFCAQIVELEVSRG